MSKLLRSRQPAQTGTLIALGIGIVGVFFFFILLHTFLGYWLGKQPYAFFINA